MKLYANEHDPVIQSHGWLPLPVAYDAAGVVADATKQEAVKAHAAGGDLALLDIEGSVHWGLRPDSPQHLRLGSIAKYRDWIKDWRTRLPAGVKVGQWSTPVAPVEYGQWSAAKRDAFADQWAKILTEIGSDVQVLNGYRRYPVAAPSDEHTGVEVEFLRHSIELADAVQVRSGLPYIIGLWHRQKSGTKAESGRTLSTAEIFPTAKLAVDSAAIGVIAWSLDAWHIGRCWSADATIGGATRSVYWPRLLTMDRAVVWDVADRDWLIADGLHARRRMCTMISHLVDDKGGQAP